MNVCNWALLWNLHPNQEAEYYQHPRSPSWVPFNHCPLPRWGWRLSAWVDLLFYVLYKWNCRGHALLGRPPFARHYVCEIHPWLPASLWFLYPQCCENIKPQLNYPFYCRWTFGWLPAPSIITRAAVNILVHVFWWLYVRFCLVYTEKWNN